MGGCRLLYFVKSKNGNNFVVFLCQYIRSFIFPEVAGRSPPSHPLNPPLWVVMTLVIVASVPLLKHLVTAR